MHRRNGLFCVTDFAELERAIPPLPDSRTKGVLVFQEDDAGAFFRPPAWGECEQSVSVCFAIVFTAV